MSLQAILLERLKREKEMSYDQIESFVREHNVITNRNYKMKTVERELNKSRTDKVETLKNLKGQIRGYKYIEEINEDDFDGQLKEILMNTAMSFKNCDKIKEINKAIKSNYEYNKRIVINKYKI